MSLLYTHWRGTVVLLIFEIYFFSPHDTKRQNRYGSSVVKAKAPDVFNLPDNPHSMSVFPSSSQGDYKQLFSNLLLLVSANK